MYTEFSRVYNNFNGCTKKVWKIIEGSSYILNVYDLVWFGFTGISTIVGYLMPNPFYEYLLNVYDLV